MDMGLAPALHSLALPQTFDSELPQVSHAGGQSLMFSERKTSGRMGFIMEQQECQDALCPTYFLCLNLVW